MMSEYKVEKYYLSSASANISSSQQQNTAQQNAKLLKNNQDTSNSTSSQNNHKTTLEVNIQKKMNKLMRFKQFNQLLVGIPQEENLNKLLDESQFNFQSFYYYYLSQKVNISFKQLITIQYINNFYLKLVQFIYPQCYAILAYVCQKILGQKIVEGILVLIKDLGIQIQTSTLDGNQSKRFLDISRVRDIVINEYLTFFSVGQYLAIIVEKEKKLVLPYPSFDLRLQELVPLFQEVKQLLSNNQ